MHESRRSGTFVAQTIADCARVREMVALGNAAVALLTSRWSFAPLCVANWWAAGPCGDLRVHLVATVGLKVGSRSCPELCGILRYPSCRAASGVSVKPRSKIVDHNAPFVGASWCSSEQKFYQVLDTTDRGPLDETVCLKNSKTSIF